MEKQIQMKKKKMNNKIIVRNIELRLAGEDSNLIEGQAVVYNSWSRDLGGFTEIIKSGAISQELVDSSDVVANINHDNNQMVARWNRGKGTLRLELREDGLWFSFEAPPTERGKELLWNIRNNNLFECSFAFALPTDASSERWYREDGQLKREICRIASLYDVSIVTLAAYPATSVDNREKIDLDIITRSLDEAEAEEKRAEEEANKLEIINKIDDKMKNFLEKINI